jgi:hypothetical protein
MASWAQFKSSQPGMAAVLLQRLEEVPICYLATVRRDGSPRVHPICPIVTDDAMYVAVAGSGRLNPSPKRWDLRNDGRFAMHAMPGPRDDEFYCTGRARFVTSMDEKGAVAAAAGHTVHPTDDVFELAVSLVMTAYWERLGEPDTYAVRRVWREG